jgi:hypothetical protein
MFYAVPNNAALWNDYKNVSRTINLTTYERKSSIIWPIGNSHSMLP